MKTYKITSRRIKAFLQDRGLTDLDGYSFQKPRIALMAYELTVETFDSSQEDPVEIHKNGKQITATELVQDVIDAKEAEVRALRDRYLETQKTP
jgi:hypothetical protein